MGGNFSTDKPTSIIVLSLNSFYYNYIHLWPLSFRQSLTLSLLLSTTKNTHGHILSKTNLLLAALFKKWLFMILNNFRTTALQTSFSINLKKTKRMKYKRNWRKLWKKFISFWTKYFLFLRRSKVCGNNISSRRNLIYSTTSPLLKLEKYLKHRKMLKYRK